MYGITTDELLRLEQESNGLCAICNRPPSGESGEARLAVDHDHATGKVRGLLCGKCNKGLGLLQDDPAILAAAIAYLEENNA
jgi:hypothetical protein